MISCACVGVIVKVFPTQKIHESWESGRRWPYIQMPKLQHQLLQFLLSPYLLLRLLLEKELEAGGQACGGINIRLLCGFIISGPISLKKKPSPDPLLSPWVLSDRGPSSRRQWLEKQGKNSPHDSKGAASHMGHLSRIDGRNCGYLQIFDLLFR